MKKYLAVLLFALCPLVPAAARLAYGIVLAAETAWLIACAAGIRAITPKLSGNPGRYLAVAFLAAATALFSLALRAYSPILSLSLGFYVYLAAFSCLLMENDVFFSGRPRRSVPSWPLIPSVVIFSAIRELLAAGTLSVPLPEGIRFFPVIPSYASYSLGFWGTSGAALILLGFVAWAAKFAQRRLNARKGEA